MMTYVLLCCQVCKRCGDEHAKIVRMRLEGAGADLDAADVQYHIKNYQKFTSERNIHAKRSETSNTLASEVAVEAFVLVVRHRQIVEFF